MSNEKIIKRINQAQGCLLGMAIGDALGTAVEFKSRGTFELVKDLRGGGAFRLAPGEWTDDTSMALCLGQSLLDHGFDLKDQISKYLLWFREGYMSVNGRCFDIGTTTRTALRRFEQTGEYPAGSSHFMDSGNGGIMRMAPVPIMYCDDLDQAVEYSMQQSSNTHDSDNCIDSAELLARVMVSALNGQDKISCLNWPDINMRSPQLKSIANMGYINKTEADIRGNGFVVDSLEASLWCFYTTDNFHDAVLKAVNLGDDADTTGAITGQIAGAFYGLSEIPDKWIKNVSWSEKILTMAHDLSLKLSNS